MPYTAQLWRKLMRVQNAPMPVPPLQPGVVAQRCLDEQLSLVVQGMGGCGQNYICDLIGNTGLLTRSETWVSHACHYPVPLPLKTVYCCGRWPESWHSQRRRRLLVANAAKLTNYDQDYVAWFIASGWRDLRYATSPWTDQWARMEEAARTREDIFVLRYGCWAQQWSELERFLGVSLPPRNAL